MLPTKKGEIRTAHSWEHKNEALFVFRCSYWGKFGLDIRIGNFGANIKGLAINRDFGDSLKSTEKSKKQKFSFLNYKLY